MAGLACIFMIAPLGLVSGEYSPTWSSLDTRPLPQWYDEAKIGIFIHWGVFSVPSFGSEWFWYRWQAEGSVDYVKFMQDNFPPNFTYANFAPRYTAEFFDPEEWVNVFQAAGAKYVVLTSKHHEGFTNWPSNTSWNWNSMDVGPKRDLVGALGAAIRKTTPDIHFGVYHSLFEWFNPLFVLDKSHGFQTNDFVTRKTLPELYDLVNKYNPDIVWSDGDGGAKDWYWNSTVFLAWLFNESPVKDTVVVNDRWGQGSLCQHGSYYTCKDRYNPGVLQPHKWENAMTLDESSWGYRRDATSDNYLTIQTVISEVVSTVSCGGNILINIGPTHDGRIAPIMEERLRQLGSWLNINGDGIYGSKPWTHQNDSSTSGIWYTSNNGMVYAYILEWPENNNLFLGSVVPAVDTEATMLGYDGKLQAIAQNPGMKVILPSLSEVNSQWTWTLVLERVNPA